MSKKLEILKNSLTNKEAKFSAKLQNHFDTVKQANGQPLNDKRNGRATLNKWERQESALRTQKTEIEKTKSAIEREEFLISGVNHALMELPDCIVKEIDLGTITQWRKHPTYFFIPDVDGCRIYWDTKKKNIGYKRPSDFNNLDQWKKFAQTFNRILLALNEEKQLKKL